MRIFVPTVDSPYYLWQCLVQAHNFSEYGEEIEPVWYVSGLMPSHLFSTLERQWPFGRLNFVKDTRSHADIFAPGAYYASTKPRLIGQFVEDTREDSRPFLVLDPDVLLTQHLPYLAPWTGSNTDDYTGAEYLAEKGALEPLCELIGVDPDTAFAGAGAQIVVDSSRPKSWWDKVALTSETAYTLMKERGEAWLLPSQRNAGDFPVQAWCSEMYVTQLMTFTDKHPRLVADESLGFSWTNSPIERWNVPNYPFFHNAGIGAEDGQHFCKITYQEHPWEADFSHVSPDTCGFNFVKEIEATKADWPSLTGLPQWRV